VTYLLCSTPVHGNVSPMVSIGAYLVSRGHRVIMLTGTRFDQRVRDAGMEFRPLAGGADFDDRDVPSYLPRHDELSGLAQAQYDIQTIFVKTIPDQYRAVIAILADEKVDAILVDGTFAGVAPLLPEANRPPIIAVGVTPLAQSSRDVAPMGMALPPSSTPIGRLRNRALGSLARHVLFRDTQATGERMFAEVGAPPLELFVMDLSSAFDRFLQLSTASFEYPRSDLAANTSFVGPLPTVPGGAPLPEWWDDLDGSRPVVHVSQGTIDNRDLDRLIRPTLAALAESDVLVVVSLGGRDGADLGELPANARVASYLPYDQLLPRTDVFITNGGYGGVQHALGHGVPLIVAGGTEDKPEVAARVAWSGVGIDLRTGTPTSRVIRSAVERVLGTNSFTDNATAMAEEIALHTPFDTIERELLTLSR